MDEREIVKSRFEEFRSRIKKAYDYENFVIKHETVHYFLYDTILLENASIKKEIKELTFEPNFIAVELSEWTAYLEKDIALKQESANPVKRKLGDYLSDFVETLKEIQLDLPVIEPKALNTNTKKRILLDSEKSILKQKQVLLLMHFLRKHRVTSDMHDNTLADLFGELTDFSNEKLRQHYSKFKNGEIEYKQRDIDELRDILAKISEDLDRITVKKSKL